jgi:hypothetical protein
LKEGAPLIVTVALLALMVSGGTEAGGDQLDCEKLPQAVKEQEDRYWKVYMGQIKGDEIAEGAKLDELTSKLKACPPPKPKPPPKSTAAAAPASAAAAPAPAAAAPVPAAAAPASGGSALVPVAAATAAVAAVKPSDAQAVAQPLEGQTIAKPLEASTAIAAAGASPLRQEFSPTEEAFCTIVREFAQQYQAMNARGDNELIVSELRSARGEALRQSLETTQVTNWTATLTKPRTTSDGDAVVQVRLPCGATLKTWNNAMSDAGSGTLIAHDSPLFGSLAKLHEDQLVVIDGQLFQGARDGFTELSFTELGAMLHPEFLFRFSNIRPP